MIGETADDRLCRDLDRDALWGAWPRSGGAIETGDKMDVVEARNNLIDLLQADGKEKDRRIAKLEALCAEAAARLVNVCPADDQLRIRLEAAGDGKELPRTELEDGFNLASYVAAQIGWSRKTFGPGARTLGLIKHIQSELVEIQKCPQDLMEWIDVVILALDGAWRAGWTPEQIIDTLQKKQAKNFTRKWPPPGPEDRANFHIKESPTGHTQSPADQANAGEGRDEQR